MALRDLISLFALAAIWGASFLFIRIAAPALGPFPLVAGRVAIAAIVLYGGMRAFGLRPALRANARKLVVLGATNAAVPFALIASAELHLTASLTAMLHASAPLWGVLFARLWLAEPLTSRRLAGVLIGVAGVGVLVGWSPMTLSLATALSTLALLAATACYAAGNIYVTKNLSHVPPLTLSLGQQVGAFAWLAVPGAIMLPRAHPTPAAIGAMLALAVVSTAIAYPLFFRLLGRIGPTKVTTLTYIIPLFGVLWGSVFLDEPVTAGMYAGLALILGSVVLVNDVSLGTLFRRSRFVAPA